MTRAGRERQPVPAASEPVLREPPSPLEAGAFRPYYERWMRERQDRDATRAASNYVDELLAEHEIEPIVRLVSCGATICRAQLSFPTVRELQTLGRIPHDWEKLQIGVPFPVENGVSIVIYWDRETAGGGSAAGAPGYRGDGGL